MFVYFMIGSHGAVIGEIAGKTAAEPLVRTDSGDGRRPHEQQGVFILRPGGQILLTAFHPRMGIFIPKGTEIGSNPRFSGYFGIGTEFA